MSCIITRWRGTRQQAKPDSVFRQGTSPEGINRVGNGRFMLHSVPAIPRVRLQNFELLRSSADGASNNAVQLTPRRPTRSAMVAYNF